MNNNQKMLFENNVKNEKEKAENNRTITLSEEEKDFYRKRLLTEEDITEFTDIINKTLDGDLFNLIKYVPEDFADLIIVDPPYNLSKNFNC